MCVCLDDWSKEDCLTLLERIRTLLPDGDTMKYKTTESHFDWEKVCFGSFTGDMCRQKWQKVSSEVKTQARHPIIYSEFCRLRQCILNRLTDLRAANSASQHDG